LGGKLEALMLRVIVVISPPLIGLGAVTGVDPNFETTS